jgi:hypothetical protein
MLYKTGEEYSNLDLIGEKYNNNKLSTVETENSQRTYKSQHLEWLNTYIINTKAQRKFRIQKNS